MSLPSIASIDVNSLNFEQAKSVISDYLTFAGLENAAGPQPNTFAFLEKAAALIVDNQTAGENQLGAASDWISIATRLGYPEDRFDRFLTQSNYVSNAVALLSTSDDGLSTNLLTSAFLVSKKDNKLQNALDRYTERAREKYQRQLAAAKETEESKKQSTTVQNKSGEQTNNNGAQKQQQQQQQSNTNEPAKTNLPLTAKSGPLSQSLTWALVIVASVILVAILALIAFFIARYVRAKRARRQSVDQTISTNNDAGRLAESQIGSSRDLYSQIDN